MERTREIAILNLLSQYKRAVFKTEEVGSLIVGLPLPSDASTILLDIENSLEPHSKVDYDNLDELTRILPKSDNVE